MGFFVSIDYEQYCFFEYILNLKLSTGFVLGATLLY